MFWACETRPPSPGLFWVSPTDLSGKYGLTEVECKRVEIAAGSGRKYSLVRALQQLVELIEGV